MLDDEFKSKLDHAESVFVNECQNVTDDAFFTFPSQLFSTKFGQCRRWAWSKISARYESEENRYQGNFYLSIMGDRCWFLQRETDVQFSSKTNASNIFGLVFRTNKYKTILVGNSYNSWHCVDIFISKSVKMSIIFILKTWYAFAFHHLKSAEIEI